ncbi:MAG: DUF4013 domain-containing protein [Coriobacteriia bacterium]|nr:DUF4013 domain-containing protein [Coriobacteriia bacterium]
MASDQRIETIGRSLKGVFGDPKWLKKSALGAVINLIPYAGMIWLTGFGLHYQRAVALGEGERLPEWNQFEPQFKTGLYALIVGLVYSVPLSVVMSAVAVVGVSAAMVGVAATEELAWFILAGVIWFVLIMFMSVLYGILLWPVYVHVQLHDTISSGFEFKEIYGRAKAHSITYWTVARRAIALGLLSMTVMLVLMALGFGGAAFLAFVVLPEELYGMATFVMSPVQLLVGVLGSLVAVPIAFATNRLWGQYARIAYDLGPAAEPAASEPAPGA